ncbi:GNAT family N-acetyltransferase [Sulfidibacter corallicola]|uniref:GNAT family N-acetyltransferase n=1 Tax=Sulfidibacter corallicola TaxID=2818388 RepID=A0A8A4TYI8_SULCO|nr:GNAT family N-acetyltransferase [Sulfidibacter corallicola]QTD54012.1 GNAT family N-acetyltransferase [Sulfidibacter corallicola]
MSTSSTNLELRMAEPADAPTILELIHELAVYEKEPDAVDCTEADILRDGFGPKPLWECLLADWNGKTVGMALFFPSWSTWSGRARLYLEDLFVKPEVRGLGAGVALLSRLAAIAQERQWACVDWQVLDWNQMARDFYHRIGASHREEWLNYRIEGEALARLAARSLEVPK